MKKAKLWLIAALTLALGAMLFAACKPEDEPESQSVTLNYATYELDMHETVQLTAQTEGDAAVTWSSSDEGVATVDAGLVRSVAAGTATITATAGEASAECKITVINTQTAPVLTLNQSSLSVDKEGEFTVEASVTYKGKAPADDYTFTWTMADGSGDFISLTPSADKMSAVVKGVEYGEATFTISTILWNIPLMQTVYVKVCNTSVSFEVEDYEPAEGVNVGTLRTRQMMRRYGRENELVYALRWTGSGHEFDMFGCIEALRRFEEQGLPVYILGFPAFLYFTLEKMEAMGLPKLRLNPSSFVSMGGGWKGFADRQVSAEEFRRYASDRLGLPDRCFHETYGAVEHGVAYVDCDEHHFHVPVYDRVIIRDPETLEPVGYGRKGILNFVSPMNTAVPVTSLMMGDFAVMHPPGSCRCGNPAPWIEIVGRAGVKANRSCAIAAAELLRRR